MDGMYMSHRETPYGWWLWAVAGWRFLRRVLGQAPGIRDLEATALTIPPPKPTTAAACPDRWPSTPRWWG